MKSITIDQFEGPLDLLLQMIEAEELEINDIALARVTEQYSRFVYESQSIPLEEVADYLVILSKLLLIKSRTLIPTLEIEEELGPTLADQLKLYQVYHQKTSVIDQLWSSPHIAFPRPKPSMEWVAQFRPPQTLAVGDLRSLMMSVIASIIPSKTVFRQLVDRAISLQQTIHTITSRLTKELRLKFSSIVGNKENKTQMIVSFLALLELVKQRRIRLEQSDAYGDITLSPHPTV